MLRRIRRLTYVMGNIRKPLDVLANRIRKRRKLSKERKAKSEDLNKVVYVQPYQLRREYLEYLVNLPFDVYWQLALIVIIPLDYLITLVSLYYQTLNNIYPDIKNVHLINATTLSICMCFSLSFLVDVIAILYHNYNKTKHIQCQKEFNKKSMCILLLASLIDLYAWVYLLFLNHTVLNKYLKILDVAICLQPLRLWRLYLIFKRYLNSVNLSIPMINIMFIVILSLIYMFSSVLYTLFAWTKVMNELNLDFTTAHLRIVSTMNYKTLETWPIDDEVSLFARAIYTSCNCLLTRGQVLYTVDSTTKAFVVLATMYMILLIKILMTVTYTLIIVSKEFRNMKYNAVTHTLKTKLRHLELSKTVLNTISEWYETLWDYREGIINTNMDVILPSGLYQDCCLDSYLPVFKHSVIFREMDITFLTAIAVQMKTVFHCTGDVLYKKGMVRSSMCYISRGTVHVMSIYDNSTPILSLLPGTCFGETTLMFSYPCTIKIVCATYCELKVLDKEDFFKLLKHFPSKFKPIFWKIESRYQDTKLLYAIKKIVQNHESNMSVGNHETGTLKRIKRVTREIDRMLYNTSTGILESADKIEKTINRHKINPDYIGASSNYLDMLTISHMTDSNFTAVSSGCPLILYPNSPFINMWESLILVQIMIMMFLIPYEAGIGNEPSYLQLILSMVVQIVLLVDLAVQCTFAVIDQDKSYTTMSTIFMRRITTMEYKIDIFGSIPINFLSILYTDYKIQNIHMWGFLKMNYLLRSWRFMYICKRLTEQTFYYRNLVVLCMFIVYFFLSICFWGMLINLLSCYKGTCDETGMLSTLEGGKGLELRPGELLLSTITYVTLLSLGVGGRQVVPFTGSEHMFILLMNSYQFFFHMYFLAVIVSVQILFYRTKDLHKEKISKILKFTDHYNVSPLLMRRILEKLQVMMMTRQRSNVFLGTGDTSGISDKLLNEIKVAAWAPYLVKVPLFQNTNQRFIYQMANICRVTVFPEHEVVCYSGMLPSFLYIIKQGHCQIINELGVAEGNKGPEWSFCILESILNIPVMKTIETVTSCVFIYIEKQTFFEVLQRFPNLHRDVQKTIKVCTHLHNFPVIEGSVITTKRFRANESFFNFGYDLVVGSKAEKEYLHPFKTVLGNFAFIQFLLLRRVILPSGPAIWIYEIMRSITALISSITFPAKVLFMYNSENYYFLFLFLDIVAFIDIYIRLHVTYYSDDGVLIKHPLMTAKHYIQNSFTTDLIASFPFEVIFGNVIPFESASYWLCFNRVLQFHRVYGLLSHMYDRKINPQPTIVVIRMFLLMLVIINTLGAIMFVFHCQVSHKIHRFKDSVFLDGVDCPEVIINRTLRGKEFTPIFVYFLFLEYITSLISQINIPKFCQWNLSRFYTIFVCLLGYALSMYIIAVVMVLVVMEKTGLRFVGQICNLMNYLKMNNVTKELREEFIIFFSQFWIQHQGQNPYTTVDLLHASLKRDILDHIYGSHLRHSMVFSRDSNFFFHGLLAILTPKVFHSGVQLLKEGYVHGDIYILHEGEITVMTGRKPSLSLGEGTIFGHLFKSLGALQPVSIVARTNVEALVTSSVSFYNLLEGYPECKRTFLRSLKIATHSGNFVIPGSYIKDVVQKKEPLLSNASKRLTSVRLKILRNLIAVVHSQYALYCICLEEFTVVSLLLNSFFDTLTMASILIECYTPYINSGVSKNYVTNHKLIMRHYMNEPLGFWFDLFTVFPFECICFLFEDAVDAYFYLHLNRVVGFLRCIHFMKSNRISEAERKLVFFKIGFYFYCFLFCLCCVDAYLYLSTAPIDELQFSVFDRFVLFIHTALRIISNLALYPIELQYYFPDKTSAYRLIQILVILICLFARGIFIGLSLQCMEAYLNEILNFIELRRDILRDLTISQVAVSLIRRVGLYLTHLWEHNSGIQSPKILELAPITLQLKLKTFLYKKHLSGHFVFSKCTPMFLENLILYFSPELIMPNGIITRCGTKPGCMYFIHSGKVVQQLLGNEEQPGIIVKHNYFGTIEGLDTRIAYTSTFRAYTKVTVVILKFQHWHHLLEYFPSDKQIIYDLLKKEKEKAGLN